MEENESPGHVAEQPPTPAHAQDECAATPQERPAHAFSSQRAPSAYPSIDLALLPRAPPGSGPNGERARWSARGEPAMHLSPPTHDSTLATFQRIAGLLGHITEQQDGIMRELRAMRREMRLMKGEQRRTSAKVISVAHNLEALKEHMQHHEG